VKFEFSDDQIELRDLVDRLVSKEWGFDIRRATIASGAGWDPQLWRKLGSLGILGAPLPAEVEGLDGGPLESMIIMQAFGRALVISPFVYTIICAAGLLARAGTAAQQEKYLPRILSGDRTMAFACSEHHDFGDLARLRTSAIRHGDHYRITGRKALIIGAPWCEHLLVVAQLPDEGACGAFVVPYHAEGVVSREFTTIDGMRASETTFDGVVVPESARIGGGRPIETELERIVDEAIVALCSEASGSIETILATTVAFAKARRQFGKPIAEFQVLRHRMVDMLIALDQATSIAHQAAASIREADPKARQRIVSAAKAHIGRVGRWVAQAAVQIHGGIGITEELEISHHFRTIEVFDMQFGTADDHVRRYARLMDEDAEGEIGADDIHTWLDSGERIVRELGCVSKQTAKT
jgi:alkylation response protein AidB-like acyl-CoA dehydrogenase